MVLVVYLGHGIFHPVQRLYFSPKTQFLGEVLSSQIGENREKKVVHLYRSARLEEVKPPEPFGRKSANPPCRGVTLFHDRVGRYSLCPRSDAIEVYTLSTYYKNKNTLQFCESEDFVETHLCKLCVGDTPIARITGCVLVKDIGRRRLPLELQ